MNIIYITASLPYGAAEPFTVPEIEELRKLGHCVTVVPMHPVGKVIHVENGWLKDVIAERLISFKIIGAFLRCLRKQNRLLLRTAALLLQGRSTGILAKNLLVFPKGIWLAELAAKLQADHIHANWASCTATIALIASEFSGVPWSFTGHRVDIQGNNLLSVKAERATFVRFISESGRQLARAAGSAVAAEKAIVVHLGVPLPDLEECPHRSTLRADAPVLLCAANLYGLKAHTDLIQAIKILRDRSIRCELWIAGAGPLRDALGQLVRTLGLERDIRFLGQLPHEDVIRFYRTRVVSCTVLASLIEGIPVSLMEAMSYGVPVVATAVGGVPELLGGGCGIIVPPRNAEALADGIASILQDDVLRSRLAQAGRQRIEEEYSATRNAETLGRLLTNSYEMRKEIPALSAR